MHRPHALLKPLSNTALLFVLFLLAMGSGCPNTEVTSGCAVRTVDGQCIDWGFSVHIRPKPSVPSPPSESERLACLAAISQVTEGDGEAVAIRDTACRKFDLLPSPRPIPRPIPPPEPEPPPTDPTPDSPR